jgi:hypothetical protein
VLRSVCVGARRTERVAKVMAEGVVSAIRAGWLKSIGHPTRFLPPCPLVPGGLASGSELPLPYRDHRWPWRLAFREPMDLVTTLPAPRQSGL